MGTNYYWSKVLDICPTCGNKDTIKIHIGKSSAGWKFLFNGDDYKSWNEWDSILDSSGEITDEYGEVWTWDDLVLKIEDKCDGLSSKDEANDEGYNSNGDYWTDPLGYEFAKGEWC